MFIEQGIQLAQRRFPHLKGSHSSRINFSASGIRIDLHGSIHYYSKKSQEAKTTQFDGKKERGKGVVPEKEGTEVTMSLSINGKRLLKVPLTMQPQHALAIYTNNKYTTNVD